MNGKSLLLGLGLGLIITSAIFLFTNSSRGMKEEPAIFSDEEVMERAQTLGMVRLSDQDIIDLAADIGMVFPAEPIEELVDEPANEQQAEEDWVEAAPLDETLDVAAEEPEGTANALDLEEQSEPVNTEENPEETVDVAINTVEVEPEPEQPVKKEIVSFRVVSGMSAQTIAKLMENHGIIDNAKDFEKHAISKNVTRVLRAGYYSIEKGTSYDDLIKLLRTPPK